MSSLTQIVLQIALTEYFKDPGPHVLAKLYHAVNAMDISRLPSLSHDERTILRSSDRKDIFLEKFVDTDEAPDPATANQALRPGSRDSQAQRGHQHTGSFSRPVSGEVVVSPTSFKTTSRPGTGQSGVGNARLPSNGSLSSLASGAVGAEGATSEFGTRSRANTLGSSNADHYYANSASTPSSATHPTQRASKTLGPIDTHSFETRITYGTQPFTIRVPLGTHPREIGHYSLVGLFQMFGGANALVPGPLHPHLHTSGAQTPSMIVLFNALVTRKRVVFLGHGQPASRVVEVVLGACALGSGCGAVLDGFLERAFPYTNLTNLDNLEAVEGFIAGVCNPAFANKPSWWDVLCNMETGKITVSKDITPAPSSTRSFATLPRGGGGGAGSPHLGSAAFEEELLGGKPAAVPAAGGAGAKAESADSVFMEEMMATIQSHYGEQIVRARMTDYCQRFVRLASRYEEENALPLATANGASISTTSLGFACTSFAPASGGRPAQLGSGLMSTDEGSLAREVSQSAGRIEGWRQTPSYALAQEAWHGRQESSPLRSFDFPHQLMRLRQARKLPTPEAELIFRTLAHHSATDEGVLAMLAHLPSHFGGLLPVAFGLLHPAEGVRGAAVDLFENLERHPTGNKFVRNLNAFYRSAYFRLREERMEAGAQEQLA